MYVLSATEVIKYEKRDLPFMENTIKKLSSLN